jgi:glycosyltransferase involved in cell wall biosynthesis
MGSDVAIYCGPAWERFSPEDIELRGLGGSETAAIRLAEHLAREHDFAVTLYGDVVEGQFRSVTYRHWRAFDPTESREAVISSRVPEIADDELNARVRMLWTHDIDFGDRLTPERARRFDHVLCLSGWHRRHLAEVHPFCAEKLWEIRNGIELAYFEGPQPERARRVISTSPPDRGLDVLLELWPEIRTRVPGAELAYAYCHVYELIASERPHLSAQIRRVRELSEQEGVSSLGSLAQPKLASLLRESLVWAHPSFSSVAGAAYPETSCIGAMEAQAAGCVVVASAWGALPETVRVGQLVGGEPGSEAWRLALVDEIVGALTNAEIQAWAQHEGPRAGAEFGWAPVARAVADLVTASPAGNRTALDRGRPTICLNMIVRDEAHVVRETLDSVASLVDCVVVVDTGSSDGTIETIRGWMEERGLPGEIHERPWRDFGTNRTEALQLAHGWADYIWVIDADDVLVGDLDLSGLRADSYLLSYREGIHYWRRQIFRDGLRWRYHGVVHEFPVCEDPATEERIEGDYHIASRRLGARNQRPDKYERDATLLREELERDGEDTRAVFYLAQSCFDAGDYAEAHRWYSRRTEMGGFAEEVFYSWMRCAACRTLQDEPWERALAAYLSAYQSRPVRAEPLYEIARHYRLADDFELGYLFARRAAEIDEPDDLLFVDSAVYQWKALDELAVSAYYTGRYDECFAVCNDLLGSTALPETERARVQSNRESCAAKLNERPIGGAKPRGSMELASRVSTVVLRELRLEVEPDWPCTGASVMTTADHLTAAVRTSNGSGPPLYYLVELDEGLAVNSVEPLRAEDGVFDELRLAVTSRGVSATGVERSEDGRARGVLLGLNGSEIGVVSPIGSDGVPSAPFVSEDRLYLVAGWSPTRVVDAARGSVLSERPSAVPGAQVGSNGVEVESGWLFVVGGSMHHRFALLDRNHGLAAASRPFSIAGGSRESCWGLARCGEDLVMAFGFEDRSAGLAFAPLDDALALLERV